MTMQKANVKPHIVEAADTLFYQNGYAFTSFADIAKAVNISRGNFYYHFKTKDEILHAVIEKRLKNTEEMLASWQEQGNSPAQRIRCFIQILIANQAKIKLYGCPVGTLTTEMAKLANPLAKEAQKVFALFQDWLELQFVALGQNPKDATQLALHLLARSQGIATMYNATHDDQFLHNEVEMLLQWLEQSTSFKQSTMD